jgi:hypothetical protein
LHDAPRAGNADRTTPSLQKNILSGRSAFPRPKVRRRCAATMRDYISDMSDEDHARGTPEWPRSEPEIIPPERGGARGSDGVFVFIDERGGARRMHVARPGPFSFVLAFVLAGLAFAGILLLAFGLVVIVVPAIAVIALALIGYLYLRGVWQRLQQRSQR